MELIILAIPLALLWLMVSRGRKQQRELLAQQDSVQVGTRVMTTSGLFAEVVEVEDEVVVLEIAPGLRTRWTKRAIGQILADDETTDEVPDETEDELSAPRTTPGTVDVSDSADRADIRSEAGYATPPNGDGTTGTPGTDGR